MLTPQEQAELQALEQERKSMMQLTSPQAQPMPTSGLTPEEEAELQSLEAERNIAKQGPQATVNPNEEADLGALTRLRYSIEPLESNRRALLIEKYGADNVKEDAEGNVLIKQGNEFQPVNKEGFSFTDVADFLGAAPENVGTVAGGAIGSLAGGIGALPSAAIGGGAGSIARQGLSALLGTPQVATPSERLGEVGLSSAFSVAGAGLGKALKGGLKKVFPSLNIDEAFKKTAKEIGVKPTAGQIGGARIGQLEERLANRPIFGRKVRKAVEEQVDVIRSNIEKNFGDISEIVPDRTIQGVGLKNKTEAITKGIKDTASNLYKEIGEEAQDVFVDSNSVKSSLIDNLKKIGVMNDNGKFAYNANKGISRESFEKIAGVSDDILNSINTTGPELNGVALDNLRRTISDNIPSQMKNQGDILLKNLEESFLDVTEQAIGAKNPALKQKFRTARGLWRQYKVNEKVMKDLKLTGNNAMADEKVLNSLFSDTKKIKALKDAKLLGDKDLDKLGIEYVSNLLKDKSGSALKSPNAVRNALIGRREVIKSAIGKEKFNNLIKNLEYASKIGNKFNSSNTANAGFAEFTPKNLMQGLLDRVGYEVLQAPRDFTEALPRLMQKGAGLVTDQTQRDISFDYFAPPKVPYRGQQNEN